MNQITNLNQGQNKAMVSMGYDNIETNITLAPGHGTVLPDPSFVGPYNIVWWNSSDYANPNNDPSAEVVRCIAKIGDTLVIMRSQQNTLSSPKNIYGKLYNMMSLPDDSLESLSYYNVPQPHGSSSHTGTIGDHTTNLSNVGSNTHAQIDTALTASAGHIAASGTSVHSLGTMSTQPASGVTVTGGSVTGITDLAVTDGGTGRGDATAYTPICGGTTSTSAHQSVASTGTTGQVLTSNGATALPTFQTISAGWTAITKAFADSPFTTAADNIILCNAVGGNMVINLPAAASNANKIYGIKKTDSSAYTITIDANSTELIDNSQTQVIAAQYDCLTIICNGLAWYII